MKTANSARSIGRIIRDARRARGLTQAELASRTGMAQATISNIERGTSQAAVESILRLFAALQLEFVVRERDGQQPAAPWDSPESGT